VSTNRLDRVLVRLYPAYSRRQLADWVSAGNVTVNGRVITKASFVVTESDTIILALPGSGAQAGLQNAAWYVSRAGFKLEKALDYFNITVEGLTALDAGLSTGGFTQCLLSRGIKKVFGIDVGSGQVHPTIRADSRVVVMENCNLKDVTVTSLGEPVDMVTLDLSFISVLKVMDAVKRVLKPGGHLVILIKPQFEVGKFAVSKARGVIKDPELREQAVSSVVAGVQEQGFTFVGCIESPILGGDGNKEFLAYFVYEQV
jgi:23S rRNA (cytidine1920-2'-O)/16S rRNA (cytidine1409-2'-O)-methyltransferase